MSNQSPIALFVSIPWYKYTPFLSPLLQRMALSIPPSSAICSKYGVIMLLIESEAVLEYREGILGTQ